MSNELNDSELSRAAEALEGWNVDGQQLVRDVSADDLDTDVLADHLRKAASERGKNIDLDVTPQGVVIRLGADQADVEFAAELDAVIAGTAPTPGTN